MRRIVIGALLVGALVSGGVPCARAEEGAQNIASPTRSPGTALRAGSAAPDFSALAASTAKAGCYFFGALLLAASLYKRFKQSSPHAASERIQVISRRSLGPRSALLLTEIDGRPFLLAQGGDDLKLLAELEPAFHTPLQAFEDDDVEDSIEAVNE